MIDRYTLPEMGKIWSDQFKYETWLKIEILATEARVGTGEVPQEDLAAIKERASFSVERINEIELTTQHDVIAFLTNVNENVGPASRHLHYGMTSSDVLDTALSVQIKEASRIILEKIDVLTDALKTRAVEHKNTLCIGRTHGIHAEVTTMGLKFAQWYDEMRRNRARFVKAIDEISTGQISGAVGTFDHLSPFVEEFVCEKLGLRPEPVSTQVIQRDRHAFYLSVLGIIGGTLEKIATEIRHLQKTEVLEAEEYFGKGQKGSSAMPHKRNPIICERITGMARLMRSYVSPAIENIALWHERDISHSSVERVVFPDATILIDYMLQKSIDLITKLIIYPENMIRNIHLTRGLIYSQKVLLALTESGMSREESYAAVQDAAMRVWRDTSLNLRDELLKNEKVVQNIDPKRFETIFDLTNSMRNIDYIFNRTLT
ncbi:MAG: adenylosuccinate lyase [Ignavibacteria bacterium]|nr:adenylosuccinate lyase [Ignavibacteria bacterium]